MNLLVSQGAKKNIFSGLPLREAPDHSTDFDMIFCVNRSTLLVEQKRIFLNLRENGRGRYLRIVEVGQLAAISYTELVCVFNE